MEAMSCVSLVSEHSYSVGRFLLVRTTEKEAITPKTARVPFNLWRTGPVLEAEKDP